MNKKIHLWDEWPSRSKTWRRFRCVAVLAVATSSATTESRVEPDGSSVCPAPAPSSLPRSYAAVVAARTATNGPCSLVRSQRSEVNFCRRC